MTDHQGRRPGLRDVAERAQVSIKTASRVVNGLSGVSPSLHARVTLAIAELGYVPNLAARSLKQGESVAIGVIVDAIADPFFAAVNGAIETGARAAGYEVLFASAGHDPDRELELLHSMQMQRVRGLIVAPTSANHARIRELAARMPVVLVDREIDGVDAVVVDDAEASRQAVAALLARGHRRIAFVGADDRFPTSRHRLDGFRRAHADAGIAIDPALVPSHVTDGEDALGASMRLLQSEAPPTAMFASNTRTAEGVLRATRRSGATPDLVTFGDVPLADVLVPSPDYIDHNPTGIGTTALERLVERIADPTSEPIVTKLASPFVTRSQPAATRGGDA